MKTSVSIYSVKESFSASAHFPPPLHVPMEGKNVTEAQKSGEAG